MVPFFNGVIFAAFVIVAIGFLKFWLRSNDRFFGMFAAAFGLLATERLVLALLNHQGWEVRAPIYMIRLIAYIVIIWAIADKNRAREIHRPKDAGTEDFAN
jgi:hypothetical protein